MERKLKRQQRTVGAIVKVPLEDGYHTYARILDVKMAFYDARTTDELAIDDIVQRPVLFIITVYDSVITQGYWEKIGKKTPLEPHLLADIPVYMQDALNPSKYTICYRKTTRPATREECIGLEPFAAWNYDNVEQRLNDHYSGRENIFVKYMLNADRKGYDDYMLEVNKIWKQKQQRQAA